MPLRTALPAVFADDWLAQCFVAGLDEVLAPFLNVLDCLDSYFTPALAPDDFVSWLAEWVGAETGTANSGAEDESRDPEGRDGPVQDVARVRAAVEAAVRLHRVRGTRHGLAEAVALAFGAEPEISESGGASWSARPLGPLPGEPRPRLHVTLRLPNPRPADEVRLDALVAAVRPVHMPYTVQVATAERLS